MSPTRAAAHTDVGRRRSHNEDAVIAAEPLFGVADGVGGAEAGEEASHLALSVLERCAAGIAGAADDAAAEQEMITAVERCNEEIHRTQHSRPELAGMATTLTAAVVRSDGRRAVIGHVGDSRAYRVATNGDITQLTDDHSVVGELVRSGQLAPAEAAHHPHRNVITRALGAEPHVEVDTLLVDIEPGDWLLLCSDGLTGHVDDDEIARAVIESVSPDIAAGRLVEQANLRGGTDNISVVLVQPLLPPDDGTPGSMGAAGTPADQATTGQLPTIDATSMQPPQATGFVGAGGGAVATAAGAAAPTGPRGPARRARPDWPGGSMRSVLLVAGLAVLAIIVAAFAWQQSYFLVEREDGRIGIDQGFPVAGLSRPHTTSDVRARDLSSYDRQQIVEQQTLRSRDDAELLLRQLPDRTVERTSGVAPAGDDERNAGRQTDRPRSDGGTADGGAAS